MTKNFKDITTACKNDVFVMVPENQNENYKFCYLRDVRFPRSLRPRPIQNVNNGIRFTIVNKRAFDTDKLSSIKDGTEIFEMSFIEAQEIPEIKLEIIDYHKLGRESRYNIDTNVGYLKKIPGREINEEITRKEYKKSVEEIYTGRLYGEIINHITFHWLHVSGKFLTKRKFSEEYGYYSLYSSPMTEREFTVKRTLINKNTKTYRTEVLKRDGLNLVLEIQDFEEVVENYLDIVEEESYFGDVRGTATERQILKVKNLRIIDSTVLSENPFESYSENWVYYEFLKLNNEKDRREFLEIVHAYLLEEDEKCKKIYQKFLEWKEEELK